MNTTKYVLFAALGVATVLLLTTDKGKKLRGDMADLAKDNAKKWKDSLKNMRKDSADSLAELKELLSSEIEGLSDDARERIEKIVNSGTKTAAKMKRTMA